MNPSIPYTRPELTADEKRMLALTAHQINMLHDMRKRLAYIGALVAENARLTKEVNEHRAARGFELLPTFDPSQGKVG
jgi:hypothetical protein